MFCVPQLTLASTRLAGIATTMFLIERLLSLLLPQLLLQLLLLQHFYSIEATHFYIFIIERKSLNALEIRVFVRSSAVIETVEMNLTSKISRSMKLRIQCHLDSICFVFL